ncbi:acyl-CoA/acyl-ACP dehydrogenase [Microbacterium sp. CFH 31415]|uniref:acyl-CoA dehydrogenase family protein n=1 Tax=Microbacterium sp. CFH 31415 TaxID=2921732 RepID=UPI001F137800|nr:acyl-CoA dehydrogenase family protein [Microbacterium sp. CFH 31415]MCH6231634.1 acyl-CoA/acyl-ACP dehydrogenase [Microbacterium sp. CFH 31415]
MDFEYPEDVREAQSLADDVFAGLAGVERVKHVENEGGGFDEELWAAVVETGLLGLAIPEEHGGAGLGMLGLTAVLERHGRYVAPIPLAASVSMALLPLSRFGTAALRDRWMPAALAGDVLLTSGIDAATTGDAALSSTPDGDGWRLTGTLEAVPAGTQAAGILVAFTGEGAVRAAIVPLDRDGISRASVAVTSRAAHARVSFDEVRVEAGDLLGDDAEPVRWARAAGRVAYAALQVGVCEEAIARAAAYTSQREQFGRPLSTNQAVTQRAADAHMDAERIKVTTRRAAWLVDRDDPAAASAVLVSAWWASKGGLRAVHATQHLHGGLGADIEYPIHRYFLWGRQLAFSLGTAASLSAELGADLASLPRIGAPA